MVHDHDLTPALQRDTLEDVEEGPEDVVEIRDVIIGIQGLFTTEIARFTFIVTTDDLLAVFIQQGRACVLPNATLLKHSHEEIEAADGEDQEEEE